MTCSITCNYGVVANRVCGYQACADIKSRGGKVVRDAGPMKSGSTMLAFLEDPDGYKIELLSPGGAQ